MDLLSSTPTDAALLETVHRGLPPIRRRAHVVVVGAGMAGLVAAYELSRAGHEVTLLEARPRVGGRIFTTREPFSDGLAGELGAMRIPVVHQLTQAYIQAFGLRTAPFHSNNPEGWSYVQGRRRRLREPVDDIFELAEHERGAGLDGLLERVLAPLRAEAAAPGGWERVERAWGRASLREFLEKSGWSPGAVEMFGVLARHESLMETSFLEFFRGSNHGASAMVRIVGGMDQLPRAFLRRVGKDVRYGAVVQALEQGAGFVRVHYESAGQRHAVTGDYLVLTLPYSVLRHVEVAPAWSAAKQRAIRQIHYDNASKIVLQFRRRFWEDEGIRFGSSVTDLPIRTVVYAETDVDTPRGLVTASYAWGQDSQRWALLDERDRTVQALQNLRLLHPRAPDEFEVGTSHAWQNDPFAGGAYTVFQPGQQARIHEDVKRPEGRIHFAGEHTSLLHRWIEGAVESGLRVATEVSAAAQRREALAPGQARPEGALEVSTRAGEGFRRALSAVHALDGRTLSECLGADGTLARQRAPGGVPDGDDGLAGATLLHHAVLRAVKAGSPGLALVQTLLEAGSDVAARCTVPPRREGSAPTRCSALELVAGARRGAVEDALALVTLLVDHGAQPDEEEARPLLLALAASTAARPTATLCRALWRSGATPDVAMAAGLGDQALVEAWLATQGPGPAQRAREETDRLDGREREALMAEALVFAARAGQHPVVALLLARGADARRAVSVDGIRMTALHAAAQADEVDVVERLLDAGADLLAADSEWSASAFGWAFNAGAARVVAALSARGGLAVEDLVYVGSTAEVKRALGGHHPDQAHQNGAPGVVLRNAAHAGRGDLCALLVELGADPSLRSPLGARPCEVAALAGHASLARALGG